MTTIAYRDGVMAADTLMSRGHEMVEGATKIIRTQDFLIGISGAITNMVPFRKFVEKHEGSCASAEDLCEFWEDAPDYAGGFSALMVDNRGRIWNVIDGPPVRIPSLFDAIGSGSAYAMGAFAMGATSQQAVRAARSLDTNTGGNVMIERINV